MDPVTKRENNPEYLRTVIAQRDIVVEEEKKLTASLTKSIEQLKSKIVDLQAINARNKQAADIEVLNLTAALQKTRTQLDELSQDKSADQFSINLLKMKANEAERDHKFLMEKQQNEYESQKDQLKAKIDKLEKTLASIKDHFKVDESIARDKKLLIEDANRDLKGFSNEKQERAVILQNQQLSYEIEYQEKQITALLEKNDKFVAEVKRLKGDLELHKEIEGDLFKRSSLAQQLIRKLNDKIKEMESHSTSLEAQHAHEPQATEEMTVSERPPTEGQAQLKKGIARLYNQNAYLKSMIKTQTHKYDTLAEVLANFLQVLNLSNKNSNSNQTEQQAGQVILSLNELRKKDMKCWTKEELETVVFLLLAQIKPFLSKQSLTLVPVAKNINISFNEETSKEAISLPKITSDFQKAFDPHKKANHFKDIPTDISTRILRSNLREWGTKVSLAQAQKKIGADAGLRANRVGKSYSLHNDSIAN